MAARQHGQDKAIMPEQWLSDALLVCAVFWGKCELEWVFLRWQSRQRTRLSQLGEQVCASAGESMQITLSSQTPTPTHTSCTHTLLSRPESCHQDFVVTQSIWVVQAHYTHFRPLLYSVLWLFVTFAPQSVTYALSRVSKCGAATLHFTDYNQSPFESPRRTPE